MCTPDVGTKPWGAQILSEQASSGKVRIVSSSTGLLTDKYRLKQELGRGSYGVVYKCANVKTGQKYACKTISKVCFLFWLTGGGALCPVSAPRRPFPPGFAHP